MPIAYQLLILFDHFDFARLSLDISLQSVFLLIRFPQLVFFFFQCEHVSCGVFLQGLLLSLCFRQLILCVRKCILQFSYFDACHVLDHLVVARRDWVAIVECHC
jgi:hypothetical protein